MNRWIVDLHCDTLLRLQQLGCTLSDAPGHINLDMLGRGGALLQCFAAFIPMNDRAEHYHITDSPWDFFQKMADLFDREMARYPDRIRPVKSMKDIRENAEADRVSALLTVEDGACIDGRIERVSALYERGVRLVTLTWNYENSLGYPNAADPAEHARGLKPFGREVVAEMNRLGMVVDVSHLSEGGFWDVAAQSKAPFVASHSCARALCDHRRNLTDAQLRTLGDKGGVCGINFCAAFLREGADYASNDDILRHMRHIADKAGLDAVALGSDFDGIGCELEMKNYRGLAHLCERIADEFGSAAAEKICSGNALRVLGEVLG